MQGLFARVKQLAFPDICAKVHSFKAVCTEITQYTKKRSTSCSVKIQSKAVPLHATKALAGRGDIVPTHSRPRRWLG
jgi:hypothetical protein